MIFLTETKCKIRSIYVGWRNFFASKPVVAEFCWQISSTCLPAFIFGFRFAFALSLASLLLRHGRAGGYMRWAVVLCNLAWFPQGGSPLAPPPHPHPTQASTSLSTIAIPIYQSWLGARGWSTPDTVKLCHVFFCKFLYTQSAKITAHSLIALTFLRREAGWSFARGRPLILTTRKGHEKSIFETLHDEIKWVMSFKK